MVGHRRRSSRPRSSCATCPRCAGPSAALIALVVAGRSSSSRSRWSAVEPATSPSFAIVVGDGGGVAGGPHRLGRPHQPRPVRHRRRRRHRGRQPHRSTRTSTCSSCCSPPGAAGALVSLVVGLPALRIKGLFLAVTTLAFAVALDQYFLNPNNFPDSIPTDVGAPAAVGAVRPRRRATTCTSSCLAFLGLSILVAHGRAQGPRRPGDDRHARQPAGRRRRRRADHQRQARRPSSLAGVIAGVAGGLHVLIAARRSTRAPTSPVDSLTVFSTAVIGGLGSIAGAIIGVLLFRSSRRSRPSATSALAHRRHRRRAARRALVLPAASASCCSTSATATCAGSPTGAASSCRASWPTSATRRRGRAPRRRRGRPAAAATLERRARRRRRATSRRAERRPLGSGPMSDLPTHRADRARRRRCCSCRGVDMAYGPVQILFGVDFDVRRGRDRRPARHQRRRQVDAAQGHLRPGASPSAARCTFKGEDVTSLPADVTTHRGISLMPGGKGVFPTLTVAENLRLAVVAHPQGPGPRRGGQGRGRGRSSRSSSSARARWPATSPAASSRCSPSAARS